AAPPAGSPDVAREAPARPLPPTVFVAGWRGPDRPGGLALILAVLCGALGFAVFVPLGRVGVGWVLGGLSAGVGVAVMAKRRRGGPRLSTADRIARADWGVSALALLSVLTFRSAWWLVTFCVLGALGCAALTVTGGRSIRAVLFSLVAAPLAS